VIAKPEAIREKIITIDRLSQAPSHLLAFVHFAQYYLHKNELTDVPTLDGTESAIFIAWNTPEGLEAKGVLVWFEDADEDCWWVQVAYVDEKYRKQGIFTKLVKELSQLANHEGMPKIVMGTHVDNLPMQTALKKNGAKNDFQIWTIRP
jgi:GNAT superfamily N-acetyltransferase